MARDGSGNYALPAGNPVSPNTVISSTWANSTLSDIGAALTQSLSKDGQTVPTANLSMGNNRLTNLANGTLAADAVNLGQLQATAGQAGGVGDRNLLVNSNFAINQRVYVSGTATTGANQATLDRWRVVTSGQSVTFGAGTPDITVTAPAGGLEQIIEAGWIAGGVYTLSWSGTATATVNGTAITNGGNTSSLTANTAVTIRFSGGTVTRAQFELGTIATQYQRRPPGVELQLCQRDFQKSYAYATGLGASTAAGRFFGGTNQSGFITWVVNLPVILKTSSTITLWDQNSNANSVLSFTAGGVSTTRAAAVANATEHSFEVQISTAGTDVVMAGHWAVATGF